MKQSLLKTGTEGFRRLFFLIPSHPEVAQIEITNRCNFNCQMCQRFDLKVPIKDMDFDTYKKIVDKLAVVKEVILTGWGEPLIHPKINEMVIYAKSKGKTVSFTSNGSLMTSSMTKKILDAGVDSISFSIDDVKAPKKDSIVHPVTTQIKNIENFQKLAKNRESRPQVIIQTTLHKDQDKRIFEVIRWASKIGADVVNINRLDMRFNKTLKRPNYDEEKKFVKKLDDAGRKYKIQTEFRSHIAFSGLSRIIYKILVPYMARGGKHCLRVYNYIYINARGKVTPCCALPLCEVGDLLKEDIEKIWKNIHFEHFRQQPYQRKICGKCDVLEVKQFN